MKKTEAKKADIILIVSLLAFSVLLVTLLLIFRSDGEVAVVEIDGVRVAEYSLSEDGEYALGGGSNLLVIEDGSAYMREANCPDLTCVKKGKVRYVGESIVCLPNRISVTVRGDSSAGGVDLVS